MYFNGGTLQILLGALGNSDGGAPDPQQKMSTESPGQQQNINQTSNSQQAPHTSPSQMSYGVSIMKILKKIDRVIIQYMAAYQWKGNSRSSYNKSKIQILNYAQTTTTKKSYEHAG